MYPATFLEMEAWTEQHMGYFQQPYCKESALNWEFAPALPTTLAVGAWRTQIGRASPEGGFYP
jgi:hypothetical protein